MVNTGKPSGACGVCRERRIKCDETKPTCLKCMRSGRACSGYSHGLKLRDQTQKTILKARRLGKPGVTNHHHNHNSNKKDTHATEKSPQRSPTPLSVHSSDGGGGGGGGGGVIKDEIIAKTQDTSWRPRSFSLPTHGDARTNGDVAVSKGHKRSTSGSMEALQQQLWSFGWQPPETEPVDPQLWQSIDTPIVDQARCYFLSSYVVYNPRSPAEGLFTFVPSLLASNQPGKDYFDDLFSAVAIAAFAARPNAGQAATVATMYYARGVTRLREALGEKANAKSDTALASTILLGFYEGLVNESVGIVSCNPHFKGAITLLRMRDQEQFSTLEGTEMFDFVMQVLIRQYELSVTCTEEDICRWAVQAGMLPKARRPHLTSMLVGNLRLKAARLTEKVDRDAKTLQEAMEILKTAQKFEKLITQRFETDDTELMGERIVPAPPQQQPPLATNHNDDDHHHNHLHEPAIVYSNWWTATRALNKYAVRLLLCHIIADVSEWLGGGPGMQDTQFQASGAKAAAIAQMDIESIMLTIPYLCTWTKGSTRGATSPCGQNDAHSTQGLTHLMVIWPLYLTGDSRFATVAQKEYIQHNLGVLAERLGVRHASAVAKYLVIQQSRSGSPLSMP